MFWQTIHHLDQQVTLIINSWHTPLTDPVWAFISMIPVWIPMYVAIVALLIWRLGWKKGLIMTLAALATFGFCDQSSNIVKDLVGRVRPAFDEFMLANGVNILEHGGRSFSFFSAHAANAFGMAVCTIIGLKLDTRLFPAGQKPNPWGRAYVIWILVWASLVAISRIFVARHYLGDVIVGTIVGILAGYGFGLLAQYVIRKFSI